MRIATWNLRRPGSPTSMRGQALLHQMRKVDADVWVLTETRDSISPGDGYVKASTSGSDREQRAGEQWTMIWSRFPVLGEEPTADPIRTACVRIETERFGNMLIYGTVLPWRTDKRWLPKRGGQAFQHVLQLQQGDWRRLRQKYLEDFLCVAGDFNQELCKRGLHVGTSLGQTALRHAMSDLSLYCVTGDDCDPVAEQTNNARRSIDHILLDASRGAGSVAHRGVWPNTASELKKLTDHFGVWIDLALPAR